MTSSYPKSTGTYAVLAAGAVVATYAGTHAYKSRIEQKYNDGIDLKNQTVEIDPVEHIRRCTFYRDIDLYSFYKKYFPNVETLGDIFYNGYTLSKNGPCVAYVDPKDTKEPIRWINYSMALEHIRFIGSHLWTHARLMPMKSTVAIISMNRPEYSFVEHACYMYGFIVLALYTTYDASMILSVLDRTRTEVLVVDNLDRVQAFKNELLQRDYLKEILVMDNVTSQENAKIRSIPTVLQTMQQGDVRPRPKIDPESIATYILTSGTTGMWEKQLIFSSSELLTIFML